MMGHQGNEQDELFYSFNLDDHVPRTHLLRGIDRYFDLDGLREHLAPHYSHTGRPSIDPELMIRMLIVGYCFGIRSERRLCEEVHLNLAYRWFCRLGLEDAVPNHSTFSKNRHGRFRDSGALRHVFESVLRRCMSEGLVEGEGFAVDASVVKADANRARGVPGSEAIDRRQDDGPSRAVKEYLSALEQENPTPSEDVELATPPKRISLTDPAARYTAAPGGPAFFAYSTNYLIDLHAGIIVDVEATPAHRSQEVESTKTMIDRVEQRFALKPKRLVGDTAYGTGPMLGWMVEEKGIEPHVPVWQRPPRSDGTFPNSDFHWIEQSDEYRCPAGHALRKERRLFKEARSHITKAGTIIYRSSQTDCASLDEKLKTGMSPLQKREIRSNAIDFFVPIRNKIRLIEQRDQAAIRILQNQINSYYLAMSKQNPNNKDLIFNHIAQWISLKTGKSIMASKVLTSFFVQNCEVCC
jgi:transposase